MTMNLKKARLVNEKTQQEMAEIVGCHVNTWRELERNPNMVTIGDAKRIAEHLGMSVAEIFLNDKENG